MATEPRIGTAIRRARERKRWTQRQLADALGVNIKSVDNWENGRTSPRSAIGALEEVLGVRFDGEPDPGPGRQSAESPEDELARLAAEMREAAARLAATRSTHPNGDANGDSRRAG